MATCKETAAPHPKTTSMFIDSAAFDDAKYRRDWLIRQILVPGQPGVVGGPRKALKTSLMIDMAISLGTGTPFLGNFAVPKPRRVAVMSGESGQATIQETARRICEAKKTTLAECDVLWSFDLPRLRNDDDRKRLSQSLHEAKARVVFIDPLYLCLLDGGAGSASNLYEVGPILLRAAQACLKAGATPIFVHHATKEGAKRAATNGQPLELDDLLFSGIGEFVRQWLLVTRTTPYVLGTGEHRLLLAAGGSTGHSGAWNVDIAEGAIKEDFSGRNWQVTVRKSNGLSGQQSAGGNGKKPPADEWSGQRE